MDFDLLDELEGLRDEDLPQPQLETSSSAPPTRYWWEEGYAEPEVKIDATERIWNETTNCYEDQPKARRRAKATGMNDDELGKREEIEGLDDILARVDKDLLEEADAEPDDYRSRPVPRRAWNPQTGAFEEVAVTEDQCQGGWILKESRLALMPETDKLEDMMKKLELEDVVQDEHIVASSSSSAQHYEVQCELEDLPTTSECPAWSRNLGQPLPDMAKMIETYAISEEHSLKDDLGHMFHVERAKEIKDLRRKKQRAAIEDVRLEDAASSRHKIDKTPLQAMRGFDLVDLPKARDKLPGMRMPKQKQVDQTSSSSSASKDVDIGLAHRLDPFAMLPGMALPGEFQRTASSASATMRNVSYLDEGVAAFAGVCGIDSGATLRKEPSVFAKTGLRSKRRMKQPVVEDVKDNIAPNFEELLDRLDYEIDDQTEQ